MILGIGTDVVEIDRVLNACRKEHFVKRIYTDKERRLIQQNRRDNEPADVDGHSLKVTARAAGNFAVKEAVAKALGTGFSGFEPADIEVLRNEAGAPYVVLYGNALDMAKAHGVRSWHVTISNTDTLAIAFVIAEGD